MEGVQQTYDFYLLSTEEEFVEININIYPNPTSESIILKLKQPEQYNYLYNIVNISGKIISANDIKDEETIISLNAQQTGIYLLNINRDNQVIKSFKIIKK